MKIKNVLFVVTLAVVLTLGISLSVQSLLAAWSEPSCNDVNNANCNAEAPVNVSTQGQTKAGDLTIDGKTHANGTFVLPRESAGVDGAMWLE